MNVGDVKTRCDTFKGKSRLSSLVFVMLVFLGLIATIFSVNGNLNDNTIDQVIFTSRNLTVVFAPNSYDAEYVNKYFNMAKNFSDVLFEDLGTFSFYSTTMKVGNVMDNTRSYRIGNEKFVIHLLGCDISNLACMFRINGVPTKRLYSSDKLLAKSSFSLNPDYELRISSIIFDYCGDARFCDLDFEAYHIVNISIIRK